MFSKPTVKSCFLACKKMFQAYRFHYLLLFTLSISRIDNNFNLDIKILILKIKRVGPSQYPHTHMSRPWQFWFYLYVLIFSTAEKFCNGVPQTVMSQSHITSFFTGMTYEHGQLSSFPRMHILLLHLLSSGYISKQLHL